jgi:hypothetical protein
MLSRVLLLVSFFTLLMSGIILASPPSAAAEPGQNAQLFMPAVVNNFCGTFFDPFEEQDTGWITGSFGALRADRVGGEYRLSFSERGSVWLVPGPVCEHVAYRAAVDARWVSQTGNFIGLLFNLDEMRRSAYLFAINTDERVWLVFKVTGESLDTIIGPTGHDAILPGDAVNRLAAERNGSIITLSINNASVGELHIADTANPVIAGVAAASYTHQQFTAASFDSFLYEAASHNQEPTN